MAHLAVSKVLSTPELILTQKESEDLAKASMRVAAFYGDIVLPEKALAWANLFMVAGATYVPRFVAYNTNKAKKKKEAQQRTDQQIIDMGQMGPFPGGMA